MNTKLISCSSLQLQLLRFILLSWFFISNVIAAIAGNQDTSLPYFQVSYQVAKATIYLMDGSKISLESIIVSDSSLRGFKDDAVYRRIDISEIRSIKIKRNSVVKGLAYGAVAGGIVGYVVGNATYNGNTSFDDDSSKQELRSWAGAVAGAVPGAFIGGIVGGIFAKRRFRIDGDIDKLNKMVKRLKKAER
jgi:hypothetical protein